MQTISLNAQYVVLFENPHDSSQFVHLAKQLYPHNSRFLHKAYIDATKRLYGYILLDLRSDQDDDLRLRTPDRLHAQVTARAQTYKRRHERTNLSE